MVDCLLTISVNQICRLFSTHQTPDSIITPGGAGLGGFLTPTGVGTSFADGRETLISNGKAYIVQPALKADVALIRAWKADTAGNLDGLVKSQRHQLREKIGCSEHRVLKGTRVSNGLMPPKSDCILHPVDFLRVHQSCLPYDRK